MGRATRETGGLPGSFTPDVMRALELLRIRSRRSFLGGRHGGHLSQKRGHGVEFVDYREYEPGDNVRHVDWAFYARSGRTYVKTFREEQNLSVSVIVDPTGSMRAGTGRKWELARDVALGVIYVALMGHDDVSLCLPGLGRRAAYSGGRSFRRAAADLASAPVAPSETLAPEVSRFVSSLRYPGAAVFVSDLLFPLDVVRASFDPLRSRNLDVTAVRIADDVDDDPLGGRPVATAEDAETGEVLTVDLSGDRAGAYRADLAAHEEAVAAYLTSAGVRHVVVRPGGDLLDVLGDALARAGLFA